MFLLNLLNHSILKGHCKVYFYIINDVAMITVCIELLLQYHFKISSLKTYSFPMADIEKPWVLFFQDPHVAPPCFTDEAASSIVFYSNSGIGKCPILGLLDTTL